MFLVEDPEAGIDLLQSSDVVYSITDGKVSQCFLMPLLMGTYEEEGCYDSGNTTAGGFDYE